MPILLTQTIIKLFKLVIKKFTVDKKRASYC